MKELFNKKALTDGLKEVLRAALFAGVGYLIAYLTTLPETQTTFIVLGILRFVDKVIHKSPVKANGLTPF